MKTIKHVELGGGCSTRRRKIIIDTCRFSENEFETMAMKEGNTSIDDEELDCIASTTETEALVAFDDLVYKYAEPFQRAIYNARLVPGERYTLAYCSEFGFPVAQKIIFKDMRLTTYAQYSDCVMFIFTPYRKRKTYEKLFMKNPF